MPDYATMSTADLVAALRTMVEEEWGSDGPHDERPAFFQAIWEAAWRLETKANAPLWTFGSDMVTCPECYAVFDPEEGGDDGDR